MAYDEDVANRLRAAFARALGPTDDIEEKKMFGGIAGMVNGHMCVGVLGTDLVVRVRSADSAAFAARPGVRPMDFTGRPMKDWFYVSAPGHAAEADLDIVVQTAMAFVRESGRKEGKPKKKTAMAPSKRGAARSPAPEVSPSKLRPGRAK